MATHNGLLPVVSTHFLCFAIVLTSTVPLKICPLQQPQPQNESQLNARRPSGKFFQMVLARPLTHHGVWAALGDEGVGLPVGNQGQH